MTLQEQIVFDMRQALKKGEKEKKMVLSTLIAEFNREKDKSISDERVIKLIKKSVQNNIDCGTENENQYIEIYLPKTLNENEIIQIINSEIQENNYSGMKDMGKLMGYFSKNYPGQYDGKLVSNIVKSKLNEK